MPRDIQRRIDLLMSDTASSPSKSLYFYWPSRYNPRDGNALRESNVLLHLSHCCLNQGWAVFSEAARHEQPGGGLDLLAYHPDSKVQMRVEGKRLIEDASFGEILEDVAKINRFRLNAEDNKGSEILSPSRCVGLIVAVTHDKDIADWWVTAGKPPSVLETARRQGVRSHLTNAENGAASTAHAITFDTWFEGVPISRNWLLYAWHDVDVGAGYKRT